MIASIEKQRAEKARRVATGAFKDFALQTSGNTPEEQTFNRESYEFLMESLGAFAREYSVEIKG